MKNPIVKLCHKSLLELYLVDCFMNCLYDIWPRTDILALNDIHFCSKLYLKKKPKFLPSTSSAATAARFQMLALWGR